MEDLICGWQRQVVALSEPNEQGVNRADLDTPPGGDRHCAHLGHTRMAITAESQRTDRRVDQQAHRWRSRSAL